jgi:3-hydroxybutyryl-CoA dehydratase
MPGNDLTDGFAGLRPGDRTRFTKTVGETDITLFAGISGDFARNHVDEAYMARSGAGGRIAHGALLVAYMSAASTRMTDRLPDDSELIPVSLGYDRIRFLRPVRIGDTVTVDYEVASVDAGARRGAAAVEVRNQRGELVAVATHVFALAPRDRLFLGADGPPESG